MNDSFLLFLKNQSINVSELLLLLLLLFSKSHIAFEF